MNKKIFSLLLSLLLAFTFVGQTIFAEEYILQESRENISMEETVSERSGNNETKTATGEDELDILNEVQTEIKSPEDTFSDNVDQNESSTVNIYTFDDLKSALDTDIASPLVLQIMNDISISEQIILTGDLELTSSTNVRLHREDNYLGNMFYIPATSNVVLSTNITLDGANILIPSNSNPGFYGSILQIKGNFIMNGGTVENNKAEKLAPIAVTDNGTMVINSGKIINNNNARDNSGGNLEDNGGGAIVLLKQGHLTMNGGIINHNKTTGYGGGVLAVHESKFILNGGEISHNEVINLNTVGGGGIFIDLSADFQMNGGLVDSNIAGNGGGITIGGVSWEEPETKVGKHEIIEGTISNNRAIWSKGIGGGIYLPSPFTDIILQNSYIKDNEAQYGGGLYTCQTGNTRIYVSNGTAIINNTAKNGGNFLEKDKGYARFNDRFYVGSRILGGGSQKIYNDGEFVNGEIINRYFEGDSEVDPAIFTDNLDDFVMLHNIVEYEHIELAEKEAKLFILDNIANYSGGGIGNNGSLDFGKEEFDKKLTVRKVWEIKGVIPERITVNLIRIDSSGGETSLESVILSENNNWEHVFEDLPGEYSYRIEEVDNNNYDVKFQTKTENNHIEIVIKNSDKIETTTISGKKTWDDENNQKGKRPKFITVNLLANGKQITSKEVSEKDNWKYSFTNLPKYADGQKIIYTITENSVEEYMTLINGNNIKNTYHPGKTSVTVTKAWNDANNKGDKRPGSIEVQLKADGKPFGKPIILNKNNNWTFTWQKLDAKKAKKTIHYTIEEKNVPVEYAVSINDIDKGNIIITNTYMQKPKTSDKSPLLLLTSLIMIALIGITSLLFIYKKEKENHNHF